MNWLSMISDSDKKAIIAELAGMLARDAHMVDAWELAVANVMKRYGFQQPQSATSVNHNISASQSEKDRHANRMLALSALITQAKQLSSTIRSGDRAQNLNSFDLAVAAVEREFKS